MKLNEFVKRLNHAVQKMQDDDETVYVINENLQVGHGEGNKKIAIICGEFSHNVNNIRISIYLILEHTRACEKNDLYLVLCSLKSFLKKFLNLTLR